MARGWESKSVEAQQDEAASKNAPKRPPLTPEAAARFREQETLRLSLQSVMQRLQHTQDARNRAMLEQARAELERKIQGLAA